MLLTRITRTFAERLDAVRRSDDRGVAIVTIVGMMAVILVLVAMVASTSIAASAFTTNSRAGLQARASADAGIDAVRARMLGGNFVCELTGTDPTFSATVTYFNNAGTQLTCSASALSGTPTRATVISTGEAAAVSTTGEDDATVGANLDIVVTPGGVSLQQAVFTESTVELTNSMYVYQSSSGTIDGHVYSNGHIDCRTNNVVQGMIFARDGITIHNTCQALGSVWAAGDIDLVASQVNLAADVFATGRVLVGTGHVGGNVIANGDVSVQNSSSLSCSSGGQANVCGSIFSLNGSVSMGYNNPFVKGSIYARNDVLVANRNPAVGQDVLAVTGNVTTSNGGRIGGAAKAGGQFVDFQTQNRPPVASSCSTTAGYTPCTAAQLTIPLTTSANPAFATSLGVFGTATPTNLGTPTSAVSVVAPPRQGFPHIKSSASEITANWAAWAKPVVTAQMCTNQGNSLRNLIDSYPAGAKVLLQFPCQVTLDNFTLNLKGDVAMMSTAGFQFNNNTNINSADGIQHEFLLITPSDAPTVTWNPVDPVNYPGQLTPVCSGGPNIRFQGQMQVASVNRFFAYTPCQFAVQNGATFTGQVYSGSAQYLSNVRVTRGLMSVPGVSIPGGSSSVASYSATINTRFDVVG